MRHAFRILEEKKQEEEEGSSSTNMDLLLSEIAFHIIFCICSRKNMLFIIREKQTFTMAASR